MILHIFRKDVKLLWPVLALVALIHIAGLMVPQEFSGTIWTFSAIATCLAVIMVVQQDPLVGVRQDWLVRPIRRRDLLLSKLLLIVLLVQLPIFLADVGAGLLKGIPADQMIPEAALRNLLLLVVVALPALAFAAVTRNIMEAIVALAAAGAAITLVMAVINPHRLLGQVVYTAQVACGLPVLTAIVWLQYFHRKTYAARLAGVAVVVAVLLAIPALPWQRAFAIQQTFSARPGGADAVRIEGAPLMIAREHMRQGLVMVRPELTVRGFAKDERVLARKITGRLVTSDAQVLSVIDNRTSYLLHADEPLGASFVLQRRDLAALKEKPAQLELDYSFELLKMSTEQSMPVGATQNMPDMGSCTTFTDFVYNNVRIHCTTPGPPACAIWTLDGVSFPNGFGGPLLCDPLQVGWYSRLGSPVRDFPGFFGFKNPGPLNDAEFLDHAVSELKNARVTMHEYRSETYFTRHLVIPVPAIPARE